MQHEEVWTSLGQVSANTGADMPGDGQRQTLPGCHGELGAAARALARGARTLAERDRVPEERLLCRTPLSLEAIGAGIAGRAAEVEPPDRAGAGVPQRVPVEEHVGTEGEVLRQTRRPRHDEAILEGNGHEAAHRGGALPCQDNAGSRAE